MLKFNRRLASRPVTFLGCALLMLAIVATEAVTLWQSYRDNWDAARRAAENVQAALAVAIERNLALLDLSLSGAQEAVETPDLDKYPAGVRNSLLFDRASSAEFLGSQLVLGPGGEVKYDSGSLEPRQGNLADRDYFRAHMLRDDAGTYLSAPFSSRLRDGDPSIALSRRLSGPDGSFQGIVLGAIRLEFFKNLFSQVRLGPRDVISVVRTDGSVVFRYPSRDGAGYAGRTVAGSPVFQRMLHSPEYFSAEASLDGVDRFYVHSQVKGFPLILSVAFSVEDAMEGWRQRAIITALVTLVLAIGVLVLVRVLQGTLKQSMAMEAKMRLASLTDPLTGLANRRAFEYELEQAWLRALRDQKPLSLIIIDGDHFKTINDTYGHAFGDEVLKMMGGTLQRAVRRPGDMVARHGGEEFAVLLPNTPSDGARQIAEGIRSRIKANGVEGQDGAVVSATVSLGVATLVPSREMEKEALFQQADEALYRAKQDGRDTVKLHSSPGPADA